MLCKVDEHTAAWAGYFALYLLPWIFLQAFYDLYRKFLLIAGDSIVPMLIQTFSIFLMIGLNVYLKLNSSYGLMACIYTSNVAAVIDFILLYIHVHCKQGTKQMLKNFEYTDMLYMKSYFLDGLPCAMLEMLDIWTFTIQIYLSSFLGVTENAA